MIAVGTDLTEFVQSQIDSGRYANLNEVVDAGLRLLQQEQLRQDIEAGVESGPALAAEEVFARLSAKYQDTSVV